MKYKAVIFDLDDTLLDSITARVISMQRVFDGVGISQLDAEPFIRNLQGTRLSAALAQLAEECGIEIDLFQDYRRTYWTKETGVLKLYPGVRSLLEELNRRGLKLGVVTTKTMATEFEGNIIGARKELQELGVERLFSVLVGFEDVSLHKPHPDGIDLALNHLGVTSDEALMVGDSAGDIGAAQAAGCRSCYATWGVPASEHNSLLASYRPDFILNSPDALLDLVI
ncbi:MAG: HAD family hydrolase [Dehalococcoidales bacterium]|nr:MAG: HAD family hydrolase [Dehalococcoidales bacterium]